MKRFRYLVFSLTFVLFAVMPPVFAQEEAAVEEAPAPEPAVEEAAAPAGDLPTDTAAIIAWCKQRDG